ncbi:MAG TPA: GGIII-like transmembrane region-containing protein, partial [Candidatus Nanoarchaeia archaeon]|nr:GGIII-like transmembrane region-containing protein [Candidatus Nanoarchaeia archaeon]
VQFDITPDEGIEQIDFKAQFKNGNNWHESDIQTINVNNSKSNTIVEKDSNPLLVFGIVGGMFAVIIIFFVVMRKRRSSSE